ncbi:MAG: hypothetical protein IJY53_08840 [Akkermansia sp.]|nr:hypothetical protein [Akkermansia sp.]
MTDTQHDTTDENMPAPMPQAEPVPAPTPAAEPPQPAPLPPVTDADGAFAPQWFARFEELQPYAATLSKFRRPEALAKSYANLEKLRGYPASPDSPRMAAFRQAVGLPESAQEFSLTRPADTPDEIWDDSLAASLAQVAYEHGVPAPAMAALCEHYAQEGRLALQAAHVAQQEAVEQAESDLRADWGARFDSNMNAVGTVLQTLGNRAGVDVATLMENPALRANADFARLMLAAASMVEEAPLHTGSPVNPRDEAYRIAHDPAHPLHEAYMRTSHPRHKYANEQYDRFAFGNS